jgi:nanoRNase/pAp phosphatase (c-di-AMP/oligoRNAs hydrolase)
MGLRELVNVIDKECKVYIQMHRPPDPDCIASAVVLSDMLNCLGYDSNVVYTGIINKTETLELIYDLEIKLISLDNEKNINLIKGNDQIIVVDCQKENSNVAKLSGEYIACIDHHPELESNKYLYVDIQPDFGACSSLIYRYAVDYGYKINPAQAALLLYGIRVDTDDLSRRKYILDIDIFCELYKLADLSILSRIGRNSIRPEDISTTITAYENLTIHDNVAYSFAGDDKAKESLAELADKIISLAGVLFVVVYSKCFNGYSFSIRSKKYTMDAGKIAKYAFSKVDGDGGGHKYMAGGMIPKVSFMDLKNEKEIMQRVIEIFEEAIKDVVTD